MSHTTKSAVQGHLDPKKHQAAVETMKKREKARVERRLGGTLARRARAGHLL